MDTQEFMKQLNEVKELILQENYKEAIILIEKLKQLEKTGNFDYNLTHRLYQLDSNARSLYNQQIILQIINGISIKYDSITFQELHRVFSEKSKIKLSIDILRREVELLILRNQLPYKIENDKIIFISIKK